ncbi:MULTISPECIES: GumC family protein [Pseudomonas]|uniref:GumC family protein n=1 Tax=Pseudomonas gingeri TaxID=117681 RepID=A0A7Y8BTK1_9PSED|nr:MULTISPECIES: GumC family protein [Pseudomonas]MPQ66299.1 lipopolysaccharide biosynthesis protein [Pseudomonas sp. MWU12-2323]NWB87483.1 GumC family protein [Pseudomonas gingeri]RBH59752.1 lipopolysaccharide biosynthesis protein [Pseudomonas sp. MWU13-2860]
MINIRSFRDLLRLFFIFKREVKTTVLVTFVVILLGAFLLPNRYESTALLLVKPGRDTSTLPIEISDRQATIIPSAQRDPIIDEERILTGRPIARLVAEQYLDELSRVPPQEGFIATLKTLVKSTVQGLLDVGRGLLQLLGLVEKQTPVERLADQLTKYFSVTHAVGSSVMEISFTWNDPQVAQTIVKSWIEQYEQERTRTLGRKSLYAFYEGESTATTKRILDYKKQIEAHLNELGAVSIGERLNDISRNLNNLRGEHLNTTRAVASTKSGLDRIKAQLDSMKKEISIGRQMSINPDRQDLQQRINAKQIERQEMLRTFKEGAPPVKAMDKAIANLEDLLKSQNAVVQRTDNLAPNPVYTRLQNSFADQEASLSRLQTQAAQQETQLNQLEQDRRQALALEPEMARLQRELDAAEKSFALYSTSTEKARIDRELDKSQISNIAVIEQATLNESRVFPKSLTMLLLAIPLSLGVGLLALYFFYLLDQRIHDGDKIESRFGVKIWTSLQDISNGSIQRRTAFTASMYRLYGVLPLEQVAEHGLAIGLTSARRGEGVSFVIEHLANLLQERGHRVRVDGQGPAHPGEILLLNAGAFFSNQEAFVTLRQADLIALIIEAESTTVPILENALSTLNTAFKRVDGIILNRRRFEIPERVLNTLARIRSHA